MIYNSVIQKERVLKMYNYGSVYGGYGTGNYQVSPYQQQNMQNRLNQMEQQYGNMMYQNNNFQNQQMQQGTQQFLKGRPVSGYDEAKACMIDLDGSLFVFPDVANNCIYTKQIMLDGSAELKTYVLQEQKQNGETNTGCVLKKDFDKIVMELRKQIEGLKEVMPYDTADGKSDVKK